MVFLSELKSKIIQTLELETELAAFSYPPQSNLGDLSLSCFALAKIRHQSPEKIAQELLVKIKDNLELKKYFSTIKTVGPYLNFFISSEYLATRLIKTIQREKNDYGTSPTGQNQRVMIEYSNGNTHKEYHVGHLRNISYGDAISHLLTASGYQVLPVSYINDFGIHVAKTIWNWQRHPIYNERPEPKGYLLGRCYAQASQLLKDNPSGKLEVTALMKEIESRQGKNYQFWQASRQWSIDYFNAIYQELNIKFAHIFYESEVVNEGLKIVKNLLAQGILKKSQGAIIADLEQYDLGVLPVIRTDGTALYVVADLALASEKFQKYNLEQSIYIVDVRQSLYFKQLFKILELMGYHKKLLHLTYDFVTLPSGMMSSRSGNIITYQELKDKISAQLLLETKQRHAGWNPAKITKVVNNLTLATIKFEMLKVNAHKIITFDITESTKFDGYTACYIQYTYARWRSVLRKSVWTDLLIKTDYQKLTAKQEKLLLLKMAKYPEIISEAAQKYNPSALTKYLFELAQLSNDYYHEVNILKSSPVIKKVRLILVRTITQVLVNGLDILGIKVLEKM